MLDLEQRRFNMSTLEITSQYTLFMFALFVNQILMNLVLDRWLSVSMTLATVTMLNYGLLRWTSTNESMIQIVQQNAGVIGSSIFSIIASLFVATLVLYIYH